MPALELQEALTGFFAHLSFKNFSPNTIRSYRGFLSRLILFLQSRLTPAEPRGASPPLLVDAMTPRLLQEWLQEISDESLSRQTIVGNVTAVRSWCKWLVHSGHLGSNPAAGLRGPRVEKRLPFVLSEADVLRLLQTPTGDGFRAVRSRAVLHVLYSTACRVSEVAGLDIADVTGRTATVRGKGHKERVVILGGPALAALRQWDKHRQRSLGDRQQSALFITSRGGRLGVRQIHRLVANLVRKAGLDDRTTVHTLRHSAATHLADRGCDLRIVSALLGHANMKTTEVYLHTSVRRLQAIHQQTHPLR
jgi:integrase/recombinase XerC